MAVRLLVAVTDRDWFEYLRTRPASLRSTFGRRVPRRLGHCKRASCDVASHESFVR